MTDEDRWVEVVAEVDRRFGRLDVLVANAGIAIMAPMLEMSLDEWRKQTAVNIDGVFLTGQARHPADAEPAPGSQAAGRSS